MIAPFAKKPVNLSLKGITMDEHGLSVDLIQLRIAKHGTAPLGNGEVQFLRSAVKQPKTLNFVEAGRIKRIRGIMHAVRVSPQFSNCMIESPRSVLNRYIPDIYLYSNVYKGEDSGSTSPGYALSLVSRRIDNNGTALF
ncbi:hypothetical protein M422DRAFT_275783 [Sphaerobolus stellatus SS14]|uniref:RNA 3'-terminal phosphate cyclase insert domain-containing protein n=1 Tax=Sphaerobolus stellatus (strain SS14) TaxID=990650 RepID=A0A0C9T403_SPHS4|nr:hypothetical protein M422DRAFT_275783 [Sphaerobolus stellatus SS14]